MKKILFSLIFIYFFVINVNSQCTYTGTPLTQVGTINTFCIDNIQTITTPVVNSGQYVIVDVVQGNNYIFSVANVFALLDENLTILNAVSNTYVSPSAFNSGASGTSITWTASLSGQIKVLLSSGSCVNDNSVGGVLTLVLNSTTNTFDSQTAFLTDQWVGHVYNYTGGAAPGGASPTSPSATGAFLPANYVGYYNVGSETIAQNFGGDLVCFPVFSNAAVRTSINTSQFAVRYRMRSTRSGCFLASFSGDDGIRIYVDGVLAFNEWKDQSTTTYNNILLNLNGNSDIVFDFYENAGQNVVNFSIAPFTAGSNNITSAVSSVLSGVSPGVIDGSAYTYNGGVINPSIAFQWQVSSDNINFTNISGATTEDYIPPAIVVASGSVITYYRRVVNASANAANCVFNSNVIAIITGAFTPCSNSGAGFTQVGAINTLCVDSSNIVSGTVNAGQFVLMNVVKGFTYLFSVPNVFASDIEVLTILDAATNGNVSPATVGNGFVGATLTWTSTLSGQIKILLSKGNCINDGTVGGAITMAINSVGNTQDSQTAFGTDNWVGHVYNWATPFPPGGASPSTISNTSPFITANYVGYYNISTETFAEGFGGNSACFPVLSNGVVRTNILADKFIVRYRMRSTKTGCYLATFNADDGIRCYVDGNLVFSEWKDQGPTTYSSVLLYLNGNSDIVVDFYENGGGNVANFSMTPFLSSSNAVIAPANVNICSGSTSALINGSAYAYNGGTINPSIAFQWQSSNDNLTFTNISGATLEDYTPPAITTLVNVKTYYRRVVTAVAVGSSCVFNSNSILINTVGTATNGTVINNQTICTGTQPANLTLSNSVGTVVRWERSLNSTFTAPTNIANTTTTLTGAAIGNLSVLTYFRAVVQTPGCPTVNSVAATINVVSSTTAGTVSSNQSICTGTSPSNLTLSGNVGNVVKWQSSSDLAFTTPVDIANTTTTLTGAAIGNLTTTTYFRAVVQNGSCAVANSNVVTITIASTTWNGTSWSNGIPTITTTAFMTGNFTSSGNLFACSLMVSNNAIVNILSTHNVTLNGKLTVDSGSSFTLNNNSNLLQQTNVTNSGNIIVKRNSSLLMRQDYTVWSSPVANQNLLSFSPLTLATRFYNYNTNTNLYNAVPSPSITTFAPAQGYLIRTPNTHPITLTIWTGTFSGVPNNGPQSVSLTNLGVGKRFNMIGNPYPSTLDMASFVAGNTANITGSIYFWRKTNSTLTTVPYCTWTAGTFVSNGEAQVFDPLGIINSGQGFFVEAKNSSTNVDFTNAMRVANNNNQFFRNSNTVDFNRIWLNATDTSGLFSQTAIGYNTNGILGLDEHDGRFINDGGIAIASLIGSEVYATQSRNFPFDNNDIVPLSFNTTTAGNFTIAIDHVDGLFSRNSEIYLKDNFNNTINNLTTASYGFAANAGKDDTRFELMFQPTVLSTTTNDFEEQNLIVFKSNEIVNINAGNSKIDNIKIFDIQGRLLSEKTKINATHSKIDTTSFTNQILIVRVILENNIVVSRKIVN